MIGLRNIKPINIIKAKNEANTEYYKESYVIVSEPKTGAIKGISGIRLLDRKSNYNYEEVIYSYVGTCLRIVRRRVLYAG